MASTIKHLRSSTADKRPVASGLADGQFAINTASGTPAVFFKDSNGGVVKVGPAHVGASAPNAVPAGSAGNSLGELWVNNSLTTPGLNYYTGSAFVNLTPSGTTTTVGLVELATPAETQTGTDAVRAVTPSGLQSKVSDSTSTTSSTTIASSTAVKSAYDLANAALPKAGGTVTGELLIGTTGSLVFEGSSDDSFETTIAVTNPTADHTITFPNVTGTVVTTGDTGTVTSTMIANDTIVNADINSAAAIAYSKLALSSGIVNTDISASAAIAHSKLAALTSANILLGNASNVATSTAVTGDVTIDNAGVTAIAAGAIVDADISASAEIAVSKLADGTARQLLQTDAAGTGVEWASNIDVPGTLDVTSAATFDSTIGASAGTASLPSITFTGDLNTGIYSPGADQVAVATNGTGRLFVDSSGNVKVGSTDNSNAGAQYITVGSPGATIGGLQLWATTTGSSFVQFGDGTASADNYRGYMAYLHANDALTFATASTERARIDSSGRLLVGTSSARSNFFGTTLSSLTQTEGTGGAAGRGSLSVINNDVSNNPPYVLLGRSGAATLGSNAAVVSGSRLGTLTFHGADGTSFIEAATVAGEVDGTPGANDMPGRLVFSTTADGAASPTERLRITSAGLVGVGTSSPGSLLHAAGKIRFGSNASYYGEIDHDASSTGSNIYDHSDSGGHIFRNGGTERLRIDSSGRLLVGTSTARTDFFNLPNHSSLHQVETVSASALQYIHYSAFRNTNDGEGSVIVLGKSRGTSAGSQTIVSANDIIGFLSFQGTDGSQPVEAARITVEVDGTPGANDMPGRIVLSTTADGASSLTERMRITSAGFVGIGTSSPSSPLHLSTGSAAASALFASTDSTAYSAGSFLSSARLRITGGSATNAYNGITFGNNSNAEGFIGFVQNASGYGDFVVQSYAGSYSEKLRVTSAGLVGIGTSSPVLPLHVESTLRSVFRASTSDTGTSNQLLFLNGSNYHYGTIGTVSGTGNVNGDVFGLGYTDAPITDFTPVLSWTANTGLVGIGTTSPDVKLHVATGNATGYIKIDGGTSPSATTGLQFRADSNTYSAEITSYQGNLQFITGVTERARIDSSGRLLVGTSTARSNVYNTTYAPQIQLEGNDNANSALSIISCFNGTSIGGQLILGKANSGSVGVNGIVASGNPLGRLSFQGNDGSEFVEGAAISAEVDGTPGANDMPGRLVFFTTADGASSPTERMRIQSSGAILIAKTTDDTNTQGIRFSQFGVGSFSRDADIPLFVNRNTDDGGLVVFRQGGVDEGSISVSGTTVSYNGAHLSRWSQLPSGAERTEILRGSVLSNIDEMCEWGDEDNEQLNRMKVSDVEGDKNVSGVFQAWDDDDDTYTNDFYCAMTGDFIIRIAEGTTVERGDLLMSAGDGTAKPQDDDIIRSKTIAKVTSTTVSCTYDDGSYCVPCVLMAC